MLTLITQRRVVLALMALQTVGTFLLLIGQWRATPNNPVLWFIGAGTLIFAGLLVAYARGWEYACHINMIFSTVSIAFALPDQFVYDQNSIIVLIPSALALVLVPTSWVMGSAIALLLLFMIRADFGPTTYTSDVRTVTIYLFVAGCMFLGRLIVDNARRTAVAETHRAETALARSEEQTRELERQAAELGAQNAAQQRLLNLVATLETPAVTLAEGVVLAPLVGRLDAQRAQTLTERLLHAVGKQRTRLVILDIAGVPELSMEVAEGLVRTTQALRLLGCAAVLTGISATTAAALAQHGSLAHVLTARSPQEALELARADNYTIDLPLR